VDLYCEQHEGEQSKLLQISRWEASSCALYGMYRVTLNELKTILKVSAQAGQKCALNKTSVESTAQDNDFQEVKI
jgi:hypothetical protein